MKKLLATAGVALMMLTPTAAYAADSTPAPVTCMLDNGETVPCVTSPVPLPSASTYTPYVEQKTKPKPPVEGAASEAAAIMILSLLFGAAVITLGWCSGRFGNN